MPKDDLGAYPGWDMSEPVVPPHSRLFHLRPVGFGTPFVECLTSYFSRLAEAHSVSPGVLHHREVLPNGAGVRNMFGCGARGRIRCPTACINGATSLAADFASVVGKLTARTDLHYLTMVPWKPLPPQLLMRGVAAWCPTCFTSWRKAGEPVYMPLLWTLEIVKYCPDHRRPLRMTCPHCGLPQSLLGQCSRVGFCTRCKRWLGSASGNDCSEGHAILRAGAPEWEVWVADQLKGLIGAGFHTPDRLTPAQLSRLIRNGTDQEGLGAFARLLAVSTAAVSKWRLGSSLPILPAYVRLARVLNVTLADLLTGRTEPDTRPVDPAEVPYWRNIRIGTKPSFDPVKTRQQMEQALQESPPPSLLAFQRRTRLHSSTLRRHFPDLCDAICQCYRQYRSDFVLKRQADRIAEFRRIALRLHGRGIELFVHRVLTRMSPPRALDYKIACDQLAEIKREILAREEAAAPARVGKRCQRSA